MKPFSIEEKIKIILQNNPTRKDQLLAEYSALEEKIDLTQIVCEQYSILYDDLAILKYQQFMDEVSAGTRQITGDMMQEAYRAVHEDLAKVLTGESKDNQEIAALQQKIQSLSADPQ